MARVKSNRDRGASKKRTASSKARVVKPSKSTMRSGAVVRKNTKKDFKAVSQSSSISRKLVLANSHLVKVLLIFTSFPDWYVVAFMSTF